MTLSRAERAELRRLGYDPDDAGLLDLLVRGLADDLEELARLRRLYPLASCVLWEAPAAACDQRRAVAGAMRADVGLVLGGWRSGKSEGLKQFLVASAMGGAHPAVQAWLHLNDLPTDVIPDGPAQVYAVALTSNDSVRYHRNDLDRLVGVGRGTWFNRNGKGEAWMYVPIPGSRSRGTIWCKSIDQKRKSFQGISVRRVWIDEEPVGEDGYDVYDECRARVADNDGSICISMIPQTGITWVHDRLVRDGMDGARVFNLDALDNPHISRSFAKLYHGMTEDEIAVKRFGQFRSKSGAIYPWADGDGDRRGPGHLCDDFPIPADWPRFRGSDYGLVNATATVWVAVGDDGTRYVYREYYEPNGESYAWHAANMAVLEGRTREGARTDRTETIQAGWGDPACPEGRDAMSAVNLDTALADNDVSRGIDRVRNLMRIGPDNRPRLKVFRSCVNTIRELRGYQWDPQRRDEVPVKKHDHTCDALRYVEGGIWRWLEL